MNNRFLIALRMLIVLYMNKYNNLFKIMEKLRILNFLNLIFLCNLFLVDFCFIVNNINHIYYAIKFLKFSNILFIFKIIAVQIMYI